jgi:hypothetical protein
MSLRPISVFFYGLFMDHGVLRAAGVQPSRLRVARLPEYALKIGERATLLPMLGHTAYGVLTTLTHPELERLYAGPGLDAYRPEAVVVYPAVGPPVPALCFNLVVGPQPHERNPEYADKLRALAVRLDLPREYVATIA